MTNKLPSSENLSFLTGGGEMGELIKNYDWSKTELGEPDNWPKSLKQTLSMMITSKFPMFLWWGNDMIQFYNDAYRPSLGVDGKHPSALGQRGQEAWQEAWDVIYPLVEEVRKTSQGTWSEDMPIPFYRNGTIESTYWTFSYSPIIDDNRYVEGILVICTETTDKVESRKALEESEQRFRTLAEGTDILIAISDETSKATYFNSAWTKLTGVPTQHLLDFGWANLIHEEDRREFVDMYMRAFERQNNWTGEFRMLDKHGNYRNLIARGSSNTHPDGSFAGYISSSADITEQKKAEKKASDAAHQMSGIVESAPFPIGVYVGREMIIELANQSIIEVYGKGQDVIGKSYLDLLPELGSQEVFDQLQLVYNTGKPFHNRNQRIDIETEGNIKHYYFNYSFLPLFDESGKVYGIVNTAADVTDLNVAQQKVLRSENNLRQTILQAPVAMCIFRGPSHVVELANVRMIALWGKTADDVINKPIFEGLPEAKDQGFEDILNTVFTSGETFYAEGVPVTLPRNGKTENVYVNFVYEAHRESDGRVSGIIALAVDVTAQMIARREIENIVALRTKELADANADLQKSNAELAQFAYIASHDLQEPLRKISTFTEMLESRIVDSIDEQSVNYLGKIKNSASRMNTLVRDVLSYSELVKERETFVAVDLNKITTTIITDFELLIDQKKATVVFEDLPVIKAIPLQMSQLFSNLIGNSLKFARKDTNPVIKITTSKVSETEKHALLLNHDTDYINIRFSDNGIGFSAEYKEKIFNIFQRLHRKSDYEGTGIGLALCKKIALNHEGDLNANGSSEKGAVFNFILPVTAIIG